MKTFPLSNMIFLCSIFLLLPSAQVNSQDVPFIDTRWRVTDVVGGVVF